MHTVAVYLPGTPYRVLVDKLEGTPAEAVELARETVWQLAAKAPVRWLCKVVTTQVVTEINDPEEGLTQ